MPDEKPQIDKFKEAAREIDCDDDDKAFRERVKKLTQPRPQPEKH